MAKNALFRMVSLTVLFPFFTTSLKVRSTVLKVDANDDNGDDDGDDDGDVDGDDDGDIY